MVSIEVVEEFLDELIDLKTNNVDNEEPSSSATCISELFGIQESIRDLYMHLKRRNAVGNLYGTFKKIMDSLRTEPETIPSFMLNSLSRQLAVCLKYCVLHIRNIQCLDFKDPDP